MKNCIMILIFFLMPSTVFSAQSWWKKWDNFPDVPRIHKEQIQILISSGEKIVLVYAGYKKGSVICGSFYIPYTAVPPKASGSRVILPFPKDYWILCY